MEFLSREFSFRRRKGSDAVDRRRGKTVTGQAEGDATPPFGTSTLRLFNKMKQGAAQLESYALIVSPTEENSSSSPSSSSPSNNNKESGGTNEMEEWEAWRKASGLSKQRAVLRARTWEKRWLQRQEALREAAELKREEEERERNRREKEKQRREAGGEEEESESAGGSSSSGSSVSSCRSKGSSSS
ncbi:Vicilin-like seed storage protein [Balamuthia mandrillaris]